MPIGVVEFQGFNGIVPSLGSKDLFVASMALYLNELHSHIMASWKKFAETQKEISERNNKTHRHQVKRKSDEKARELEGQRRQIEISVIHTARRQAGQFRYFQGQHLASEGRHLNLPI